MHWCFTRPFSPPQAVKGCACEAIQWALTTSDIEKAELEHRVEELNEQCRMLTRDAVDFGTSSDAEAHEVSGRTSQLIQSQR